MSTFYSDGKQGWSDKVLWAAVEGEPVKTIKVQDLPEYDGIQGLVKDFERITACDPTFPVTLTPDGHLADGYHRCAKQLLRGEDTVPARRIVVMPPPDRPSTRVWRYDAQRRSAVRDTGPGESRVWIEGDDLVLQPCGEVAPTRIPLSWLRATPSP